MERPVLLCGLGRVGWRVFDSLRAAGVPVAVIDTHLDASDPRLADVKCVKGDCRQPAVLEQAGVKDAGGVLILTSDDLVNISTALLIRRLNPDVRVVVRMFNQNLIPRFGTAVKNTVALSVSGLTAPMLALTAATGDALGAFKLESGPQQISELEITEDSEHSGKTVRDVVTPNNLIAVALISRSGVSHLLLDIPTDAILSAGDRLVLAGAPGDLRPLLARSRGEILPGVQWASRVRRWIRTARTTLAEVDLSVKVITPVLFITLLVSTLIFRWALDRSWGDGLYETVSIAATGSELHGENQPEWAKVFLSILKLAGAALIAGFTAILTNYLIRARLGGALEVRRVPDGGHIVVCGLGNIGYRAVEELVALGERVVAIDRTNDNPFIATCRRKGVPTFVGDATVPEVLRQASTTTAKAVVASSDSELANLEIALLVREMNPKLRVVVRLSEPLFAQAVRDAADIKYAVSIPSLAAPAFAAALFGDRVQTLITVAGHTLAVVEFIVQENDPCLGGKTLRAAAIDYRFLAVAVRGKDPVTPLEHLFQAGDCITAIVELSDLERVLRREAMPRDRRVVVNDFPAAASNTIATMIQASRKCTAEEAGAMVGTPPLTVAEALTRGEAEDIVERLARAGATGKLV